MDYRGNIIIKKLMKEKEMSMEALSLLLHTTLRNTQHLIYELNEDLRVHNLPILIIDHENCVRFSNAYESISKDLQYFLIHNNFYTYRLTKDERRTIIAMILLNSTTYVTANELSEHLQTSRSTILMDVNEIKKYFDSRQIQLVSRISKGYIVDQKERTIRAEILHLLELNFNHSMYVEYDTYWHFLIREIIGEDILPKLSDIVDQVEKECGYILSDFSFSETVYEYLIMISRLKKGRVIEDTYTKDILKSSKYRLSQGIAMQIQQEWDIEVPEAEIKNMIQRFREKSYVYSYTKNLSEIAMPVLIGEAIFQITNRFQLNFYLDNHLYDVLVDHMKSAVYRTRNHEVLHNPFTQNIKDKYPEIFSVVKEEMKPLERYVNQPFNDDEIAFLVMYFGAMYEKQKVDTQVKQRVRVLLVTKLGRGVQQLIRGKLESLKELIEFIDGDTAHRLHKEDLQQHQIDLIISSEDVKSFGIPYVNIDGPVLSEEDIRNIRIEALKILDEKHQQNQTRQMQARIRKPAKKHSVSSSYLKPESVVLDYCAKDWRDAVRKAGQLLYQAGAVKQTYIESMITTIEKNGGEENSYIAISQDTIMPHADPADGAVYDAMSLVRLSQPVRFGNIWVKYVAAISVLSSDSINDFVFTLINIFHDEEIVEYMDTLDTPCQMYEFVTGLI